MEDNIYYHIHKIDEGINEVKWIEVTIFNIGDDYNYFYKQSVQFEPKYSIFENKNNVPWTNVYDYLLKSGQLNYINACKLLEFANIIISEYQMLLRENTYEEIRTKNFSYLPSRTRCIWLCKEKQLEFWKKQLCGKKYKIFKVKVFGETFKSNNNMIVVPSTSYNKTKEMAQKYWNYKSNEEKENDEYLYIGKIEVIKEIL